MASYSQLDQLKRDIVYRAIEAQMSFGLWTGTAESGFDYSWNDAGSGTGQSHTVHAPGPGSAPVAPVQVGPHEVDVQAIYDSWQQKIDAAFEDWDSLPEPGDFDAPVDAIGRAAFHCCGETTVSDTAANGVNPALRELTAIPGEIGPFNGETIDAFYLNYAGPLPQTVRGYYNLACHLATGAAGERELWKNTRQAVADLAVAAASAMEAAHYQSSSDMSLTYKVLGSFLGGAAIVFSGGTAAPIIGAASFVVGELDKYKPEPPKSEESTSSLAGSSPDEVYDNMVKALQDISDDVATEEASIETAMNQAGSDVAGHPGRWTLASGDTGGLLGETDRDQIISDDHDGIEVDFDTMARVGEEYMPAVAKELMLASDELASARTPSPWYRSPGVGLGTFGPYFALQDLLDQVGQLLNDQALLIKQAGHRLAIAAGDMRATDEAVNDQLAQDAAALQDQEATPFVPPPTTFPPGPRGVPTPF